ncbi:hypothetical protein [Bradyrhizobium sp. CCGUVB23]|uniref:hypothetical protein n=1 Tax=Bradyrhizobium sp. CCGUVB23 TaxID=2949630 RepID=UPI0020B456D8|nr:hypothetical protein [Bradyrhizobium sp. CCGUVB23]MCP3468511.1 hypothetical protein [Bradyrhizobium sp. CCGUVB23]
MDFDSRYQDEKNGPLKKDLRDRLRRFRSLFTLAEIGDTLKFSGPFVSQLLNEKNPARVDSKHIERIVRAIEEGEVKHAKKLGLNKPQHQIGSPTPAYDEKQTLDYHLAAIDALGWKITGLQRKD